MQKVIGVTDLQRRFRSVLDEVVQQGTPYVLIRESRPEAVLVPYEDYLRLQSLQETEVLNRFDRLMARMAAQNADYTDEEVAADIDAARGS
jgi:prevent-host-death family protein